MRILHLEDNPSDAILVERSIKSQGIDATFLPVSSADEFSAALKAGGFDVVLVDNGLPGYGALHAVTQSKSMHPETPVIVCSGGARDADVAATLSAGASDYVLKDYPWMLAVALRRTTATIGTARPLRPEAMHLLIDVVQKLSLARGLDAIVDIVRVAARTLTGADGATFVLRDGDQCYYVDEDAISPLWKGQRFPLEACISGWAMLNRKSTVIPDIYKDPRIPHDAYRPTFVRSLAMVPIRSAQPIGAIGNYWASQHECTPSELALLEALANSTAVAMENVNVYENLERQVRERTRELQAANQELEAFSSAVSHDLRAPLRLMNAQLDAIGERVGPLDGDAVAKLRDCTSRMSNLIDDLLRLSRISRTELQLEQTDLAMLAECIMQRLRAAEPSRSLELHIDVGGPVDADRGLMSVALENLLSNAWKYTSRSARSRIDFSRRRDHAGKVTYSISDTGAGFDPRYADQLFKPFGRLHSAREFPGVGIGLATVQRIIQRHGGEIWAHSEGPGQGAQFMFTLRDEGYGARP
jgi:signal transduction histidine kinase/CheY-like chemotaxis protein